MFFRPPRQSRVTGRNVDQMIQIGASHTQSAFLSGQRDPGFGTEIFATLAANGFAGRDKDLEFFYFVLVRCHSRPQGGSMGSAYRMSDDVSVDRRSTRLV